VSSGPYPLRIRGKTHEEKKKREGVARGVYEGNETRDYRSRAADRGSRISHSPATGGTRLRKMRRI